MKRLVTKTIIICFALVAGLMISCNDNDNPIATLPTPTNLEYTVIDHSKVELDWDAVESAESYTIEVFLNGNLNFESDPISIIPDVADNSYTLINLSSNTEYSVRICAVSNVFNESEWVGITFKTNEEQLFEAVDPDDVTETQVTLRWTAGQVATKIILTPGDIEYDITLNDIGNGKVTVTGLTSGTEYTAKLMNNDVVRGTIVFTTPTPKQKQVLYLTGDIIDGVDEWVNSVDAIGTGLQVLFSDNSEDETYTYTGLMKGLKEFKLPTVAGSNNDQYGYDNTAYKLKLNHMENIVGPYAASYYTLTVDLSTLIVDFAPYNAGATAPTYSSMGIYGDATPNGWTTVTSMIGVSPHVWVIKEVELSMGALSFRADNAFADYWGATSDNDLPFGRAVKSSESSSRIMEAGTYFIQFNDLTGHYVIIKKSDLKVATE